MCYHALVADYDGTLAFEGKVAPKVLQSLIDLKSSGRKLILATGRQLDDFLSVFDHPELFDRIVFKSGGFFYDPAARKEKLLAEPPPSAFIDELQRRGVSGIALGKVVVATWRPQEDRVLRAIQDMG